jgi:hypothetical protein
MVSAVLSAQRNLLVMGQAADSFADGGPCARPAVQQVFAWNGSIIRLGGSTA